MTKDWQGVSYQPANTSSVRSEAVQQAGAAGADQILLAAAALRSARRMRRIPGTHRRRGSTGAVGMSEHRRALRAACPVLAGIVLTRRECGAIWPRSRQHVMAVWRVAQALFVLAPLLQRRLVGEVLVAVEPTAIPRQS